MIGRTTPGFEAISTTVENNALWQIKGGGDVVFDGNAVIVSTAVDAGNTPTTTLRQCLVMAKNSSGKWVAYDPTGSGGVQQAQGILVKEMVMLNPRTGVVEDQYAGNAIIIGGRIKSSALIGLDRQARNQLSGRFHFDDENAPSHAPFRLPVNKTANYTVVAADNGTVFETTGASGAVTFTLPTIAVGLRFMFVNTVDQNMAVTSADANKLVGVNSAASTTITASTSSQKIGAILEVVAMYLGGTLKWVVFNRSPGVVTLTLS